MSGSSDICHACWHAYPTRDTEAWLRPDCCPRCLAPRRRGVVFTPTTIEAWLLCLYGHPASYEKHGVLEHVLRAQARDEETVHAVLNEIRNLDIPNFIASINVRREEWFGFDLVDLDQALADLAAEARQGILSWRLDQIERRCVAILQNERRHHEWLLQERRNEKSQVP